MSAFAVHWPEAEPAAVNLLRQIQPRFVWLPLEAPGDRQAFLAACRAAGIRPIAEVGQYASDKLAAARQAGFEGAAFWPTSEKSPAGAVPLDGWQLFALLDPTRIHWKVEPVRAVLVAGAWPGARRMDPAAASATQQAWLDANTYWIACLRGLFPGREAWLCYPEANPLPQAGRGSGYGVVELALAEAAVLGGSIVLTLPEPYRRALERGDEQALLAWKSLAATANFLRQHEQTFRRPGASRVVVASPGLEECAEIVNLLFRHNVSPSVVGADAVPAFGHCRILVAAGLEKHTAAVKAAIRFASAGGQVLATPTSGDPAIWRQMMGARKVRSEPERDFYTVGRGSIIVYREPASDPGEFALDVIDVMGWRTRDLRIWGTSTVVGILHRLEGARVSVELLGYAGATRDFLLRLEGQFTRATLRLPVGQARELRAARRGSGTEIEVPRIERVASLLLE